MTEEEYLAIQNRVLSRAYLDIYTQLETLIELAEHNLSALNSKRSKSDPNFRHLKANVKIKIEEFKRFEAI